MASKPAYEREQVQKEPSAPAVILLLAGLLLALSPAPAAAQAPVASAVMYEVNEALRFLKHGDEDRDKDKGKDDKEKGDHPSNDAAELALRLAHASLLGREVRPLVPHDIFRAGSFIQADATSSVNLATGRGPIIGKLNLLMDLDPTRNSLDTLLITTAAQIKGSLDLTTASQGFAAMSGEWKAKGQNRREGTFQGLFLIPFQVPGDERYFYLDLGLEGPGTLCSSQAGVCPLQDHEFALGIPLTKALVMFFE